MKSHTLEPTKNKALFRIVNREGDWRNYFHAPLRRVLRAVNAVLEKGYPNGQWYREYLLRSTPEEAKQRMEDRSERGSHIHNAAEVLFGMAEKGKKPKLELSEGIYSKREKIHTPLTDDEWGRILSFGRFCEAHGLVLIRFEEPVWNLTVGYAGTLDVLGILTKRCGEEKCGCANVKGKVGLIDLKTSPRIYSRFLSQEEAYSRGDNIPELLPKGMKIEYVATCRLFAPRRLQGGWEFKATIGAARERAWTRFLGAYAIAEHEERLFDMKRDVFEIPEKMTLSITRFKSYGQSKKNRKGA